jgi:transposase
LPERLAGQAFCNPKSEIYNPKWYNLWVGACVVMDNLSSHGVGGMRELIEAASAKLVYLSPYSPDFNP